MPTNRSKSETDKRVMPEAQNFKLLRNRDPRSVHITQDNLNLSRNRLENRSNITEVRLDYRSDVNSAFELNVSDLSARTKK